MCDACMYSYSYKCMCVNMYITIGLRCLFTATDQPPAYPHNDKPPDYHDICPRQAVSPPPVDNLSPENTPAVHILVTTTGISSAVYSSNTGTSTIDINTTTNTTR